MNIKFYALGLIVLISMGCGDDSITSSSSSSITSISSLPAATDAVSSSSAVSLEKDPTSHALATTGLKLAGAGNETWGSDKSRLFCEATRYLNDAYREADDPKKIMCYMGAMEQGGILSNVYSGEYVYFKLTNMSGGGAATPKVRMKSTKNAGGGIDNFVMEMCFSSDTQDGHISQVISGGTVTVTSVNSFSDGTNTYGARFVAEGAHDGESWTSKTSTVTYRAVFNDESLSGTFASKTTIVETDSHWDIDSNDTSSFTGSSEAGYSFSDSNTVALTARGQIINGGTKNVALGDIAGKIAVAFSRDYNGIADDNFSKTFIEGANGDTQASLSDASASDFYAVVNARSLPTATVVASDTDFSGDEVWDCTAPSGFTEVDLSNLNSTAETAFAACDSEAMSGTTGWIDCHGTGEQGGGDAHDAI